MYLKLSSAIESQLREAYARRHEESGITQSDLAKKLEVDRSAIHNRLNGKCNMTVETIANMIWALGHDVSINIFDPGIRTKMNFFVLGDEEENSGSNFIESSADHTEIEFEPVSSS